MDLDFSVAWIYLPILLQAAVMTVWLTVLSQTIGTAAARLHLVTPPARHGASRREG